MIFLLSSGCCLVAEVEEKREEGQEESWEVESGAQSEEVAHMDGHGDGVKCGQGSNLSQMCEWMVKGGETSACMRALSGCTCECCGAPRNR